MIRESQKITPRVRLPACVQTPDKQKGTDSMNQIFLTDFVSYTGLRPGEKLYEELFYENENRKETEHVKILLANHPEIY